MNTDPKYWREFEAEAFAISPEHRRLAGAHASALEKLKIAEEALETIREIWAGSECGEPVHAQEAYAIMLCKAQYQAACDAIKAIRGKP